MDADRLTVRQRLKRFLSERAYTSRELAGLVGCAERIIEDHLVHVSRSLNRHPSHVFVMEPPVCLECGYSFRNRVKFTRPSRCPRCREEGVSAPRFSIVPRQTQHHAS